MGKICLAFAMGVILTSLAGFWFYGTDQSLVPPNATYERPIPGRISPDSDDVASVTIEAAETPVKNPAERSTSADLPGDSSEELVSRRERVQRQFDDAQHALEEAQRAFEEAALAVEQLEFSQLRAEPIVTSRPLPREFDWLTAGLSSYRTNHERIQREPRDESWAGPTELQLSNFLYEHKDFIQRYGAPTVTCGATLCEITVVGYGISADVSRRDFADLGEDFRDDPMYDVLFDSRRTSWVHNNEDGIATLIVSLTRQERTQQTQSKVTTALR